MQYYFFPSPKREEARKYSPSLLAERSQRRAGVPPVEATGVGLGGEVPCIAIKTEPLRMIVF